MQTAYIVRTITNALKNKKLLLWFLLLIASASGPLIVTYLFSQGISALENSQPLKQVLWIFFTVLIISSIEIFMRIAAKTRIHHIVDDCLIGLQQEFLKNVKPRSKFRKPTVQAIRNLTRSIQLFATSFINSGVSGLVSFVSVPFLLFFIDRRVFLAVISMMFIYLIVTTVYSYKYEKQYERYDEAREKYFIKMGSSNKVAHKGRGMSQAILRLQNIRFYEWASVQNIIVIFQFVITAMLVIDIINGFKGISDLFLVTGYVNEVKKFLNNITGDLNKGMQIKAGVERLAINSQGGSPGSVVSLK